VGRLKCAISGYSRAFSPAIEWRLCIREGKSSTPEIDRIVDEPARLAILTVLASCQSADFLFLEPARGLMRGNLSVQLTRLEEAGPVKSGRLTALAG
jgi:Winged helix DNA-binding domain